MKYERIPGKGRVMLHRFLGIDLITRCSILSQTALTCALAWFVPTSLTAKLVASGHDYGQIQLLLLTGAVLLGWLDVLINDLLPESWQWCWSRKRRHTIYHVLAGLFFVQAFAGVGSTLDVEDILSVAYLLNGSMAAWYSWSVSIKATHV